MPMAAVLHPSYPWSHPVNNPPSPTAATPAKRLYVAPALVVHGDVQTITQSASEVNTADKASLLSAP